MKNKREIIQLLEVAKYYFSLIEQTIKEENVSDKELSYTINDWTKICEDLDELKKHKGLLHVSAHLDSCAIRLYSIEESDKMDSESYKLYYNYWYMKDISKIMKERFRHDIPEIVHFLLRHSTSHAEDLISKETCKFMQSEFYKYKFSELKNIIKNTLDSLIEKYSDLYPTHS